VYNQEFSINGVAMGVNKGLESPYTNTTMFSTYVSTAFQMYLIDKLLLSSDHFGLNM